MPCEDRTTTDSAPNPPQGLIAVNTSLGVQLYWQPNFESDLAGYRVYRAEGEESGVYTELTSSLRTVPDWNDTTGVAEVAYWYRVTAEDAAGNESGYSVVSGMRSAADATAPGAPANPTVSLTGATTLQISWDNNLEPDLAGYNLYRSTTSGSGYALVNTSDLLTTTSYTDSGLAADDYFYQLTAVDSSGNESVFSSEVTATVPVSDILAPATPANLVLSASESGITLSWDANTEPDLDGYNVSSSPDGVGSWTLLTASLITEATYTDTTATVGSPTYYRVSAVDASTNESGYATGNATRPEEVPSSGTLPLSYAGTMAPAVVHVRLVNKSQIEQEFSETEFDITTEFSGALKNPLFNQHEFNFAAGTGQDQGRYPTLRGFNAAHVYDKAGKYTITGTITPADRSTPSVFSREVTILTDTRTKIYVSANGSGSGSGTSRSSPVSPGRAQQILDASSGSLNIIFLNTARYDWNTFTFKVSKDNCIIGGENNDSRALFMYTNQQKHRQFFNIPEGTANTVCQYMTFDGNYPRGGERGTNYDRAFKIDGENTLIRNCTFLHIDNAIIPSETSPMSGLLCLDCDCPLEDAIYGNFGSNCSGRDLVFLNLTVTNSYEHSLRLAAVDRLLVAFCKLQNLNRTDITPDDTSLQSLRISTSNFTYVYGNNIVQTQHDDKPMEAYAQLGPLNRCTGTPGNRITYSVWERNYINTSLQVFHGVNHVMIRNNIFDWQRADMLHVTGHRNADSDCSPPIEFRRGNHEIYVYNNTFINRGTSGAIFRGGYVGTEDGSSGPITNGEWYIKNNLTIGGQLSNAYNVRVIGLDQMNFDRNIWSSLVNFRVGSTTRSLSSWNSDSAVGTDDTENITLNSNLEPATGSKARTFARPVQGIWEDYRGNARNLSDANWSAGAVEV